MSTNDTNATNATNVSGILICVVCGMIDATCFAALGNTFAGLMTGNLILMGLTLGGSNTGVQATIFLYPLAGYALGALLAGLWFKCQIPAQSERRGLWLGWLVLAAATLFTWLFESAAHTREGWVVVILASLYMGFQSAVLYLAKRVTITTNVMTSTLTSLLGDFPLQIARHAISLNKLWALIGFLIGVIIGALLIPMGIRFSFSLALVLATFAIIRLTQRGDGQSSP